MATDDHMIDPGQQRAMAAKIEATTRELPTSTFRWRPTQGRGGSHRRSSHAGHREPRSRNELEGSSPVGLRCEIAASILDLLERKLTRPAKSAAIDVE